MSLTPKQRALYGRIGAAIARSRHRPEDLTAQARKRFLERFEQEIRDTQPELPEGEIRRRAGELRRAHMLRLSVKASTDRTKKAAAARKSATAGGSIRDGSTTDHRAEL
jgi:hypothetical protein